MHIRIARLWLSAAAVIALLPACATGELTTVDALPPVAAQGAYVLGPGDTVRLSLYGDESFSGEFSVSTNGEISVPLIGNQKAGGLTVSTLQNLISARLAAGYYQDPRLTAEIISYRPFYIIGEINRPGEYPYSAGLTLKKAVAVAGGYTYRANTKKVSIQRGEMDKPLHIPSESRILIGPGDTIEILERYF